MSAIIPNANPDLILVAAADGSGRRGEPAETEYPIIAWWTVVTHRGAMKTRPVTVVRGLEARAIRDRRTGAEFALEDAPG